MTNQIEQGSDEWKQLRLGKVTASRIADVMSQIKSGESQSRSNYRIELVCERLSGEPTDSFTNSHMQRGTELEPFARSAYEIKNKVFVEQVSFCDHLTVSMSGASPDGLVGKDGLIEIKCPMTKTHIETLLGKQVPAKYIKQIQWQLACTNRKWCDFVSYCPELPENMQLFISRVERDDEVIDSIAKAVIEFNLEVEQVIERLKGL